jgi:hypothetical protein
LVVAAVCGTVAVVWILSNTSSNNLPMFFYLDAAPRFFFQVMAPALLVHIWLPLFVFGAIGVRLLYAVIRTIQGAQWFLDQGDRHPLRAIGVVATVLVFAGAFIAKAFAAI